ncbi:MAG TPA: hypothetical protein DHW71_08055 [Gammaproteobacteria bacterium]|nr:hypothetical protein [Gammaproteobacteria bacterium]
MGNAMGVLSSFGLQDKQYLPPNDQGKSRVYNLPESPKKLLDFMRFINHGQSHYQLSDQFNSQILVSTRLLKEGSTLKPLNDIEYKNVISGRLAEFAEKGVPNDDHATSDKFKSAAFFEGLEADSLDMANQLQDISVRIYNDEMFRTGVNFNQEDKSVTINTANFDSGQVFVFSNGVTMTMDLKSLDGSTLSDKDSIAESSSDYESAKQEILNEPDTDSNSSELNEAQLQFEQIDKMQIEKSATCIEKAMDYFMKDESLMGNFMTAFDHYSKLQEYLVDDSKATEIK